MSTQSIPPPRGSANPAAELAALRPFLYGVARRYVEHEQDAEDVAQEAAYQAWRGWHTCREPRARVKWLAVIVRREATRHRQRAARQPWLPLEDAARIPAPDALPDFLLPLSALSGLTARQAQALLLTAAGLEQGDVAAVQGVRVGTVKKRLHDARRKVTQRMEGTP
jgi:RNA polymerase sigma factor (sigma-70 family)